MICPTCMDTFCERQTDAKCPYCKKPFCSMACLMKHTPVEYDGFDCRTFMPKKPKKGKVK